MHDKMIFHIGDIDTEVVYVGLHVHQTTLYEIIG